MGDFGKIYDKTKFTYEEDKIYAFKPQPDRYLSFFTKDKKMIVTNAFWKKTQKMPRGEKELAIKNMNEYNSRNGGK
jgi:phage-related protein